MVSSRAGLYVWSWTMMRTNSRYWSGGSSGQQWRGDTLSFCKGRFYLGEVLRLVCRQQGSRRLLCLLRFEMRGFYSPASRENWRFKFLGWIHSNFPIAVIWIPLLFYQGPCLLDRRSIVVDHTAFFAVLPPLWFNSMSDFLAILLSRGERTGFWGASIPFSTVAVPLHIPTHSAQGLQLLHILKGNSPRFSVETVN